MSTLPIAGYLSNAVRTEGEAKTALEDMLASVKQIPGAGVAETTLTIASGSITPPSGGPGIFKIETEAATAADDLTNIVQTNIPDGSMIWIRCANAARVPTVKHAAGGSGQATLANAQDLVLDDVLKWICLKRTGTLWEAVVSPVLLSPTLRLGLVTADPLVPLGVASQQYVNQKNLMSVMENGRITVTMAANAVTIALKGNDGSDPSPTNPVRITFRSATLTDGSVVTRTIIAALSMVISSGSTGGTLSAIAARLYIGLLDNAGAVELYWFNTLSGTSLSAPSETELITTAAEGGVGGADSAQVLYSTTARSGKAHRIVAFFEATEATAGTWATAASKIQLLGPGVRRTGDVVQVAYAQTGAVANGSVAIPHDDTIPQITEGFEFMTLALTPSNTINRLLIDHVGYYASTGIVNISLALFQDAAVNALAAVNTVPASANAFTPIMLRHEMRAGTVSSTTFRIRSGTPAGATVTINGENTARIFGGVIPSSLRVTEIVV